MPVPGQPDRPSLDRSTSGAPVWPTRAGKRSALTRRPSADASIAVSLTADGEVSLHNARITASASFGEAKLTNPDGHALSAGGLVVGGGLHLTAGFESVGEVRLLGAKLAANLSLTGAKLSNPGGIAVNLDRAAISVCHASGLTAADRFSFRSHRPGRSKGMVDFSHAHIEVYRDDPSKLAGRTERRRHDLSGSRAPVARPRTAALAGQWLSYVLIAAGWILMTTVAAAARVLGRG